MRKPAWLDRFAPSDSPQRLKPVRCSNCGRWLIEMRDQTQWEHWDAGIITGDDITVALICKRTLDRIIDTDPPVLATTWAGIGIDADGQYLARHDCMLPTISTRPWQPPSHDQCEQDLSFLPTVRMTDGDPWAAKQAQNSGEVDL